MSSLEKQIEEQQKLIKFLASKYEKDTGRSIKLPTTLSQLLDDPSVKGDNKLVELEDEKFNADLRKGRIAAETLNRPMTFFEAVEALGLPRTEDHGGDKKKGAPADKNKVETVAL